MAFFNENIETILKKLKTSENGISSSSVDERKQEFGKNELDKQKKPSFSKKLLAQFKNVMIIILIISAIISEISAITNKDTESLFEGILIFVIVLINAVVGVIQEQKAENALLALQKSIEPYAKVIRNGSLQKIKIHDLVVGDIIELKAGDYVPADARIITSNNLKCDESSLTGESHSVSKSNRTLEKQDLPLADQENICFSGTTVTSGSATCVVFAVGKSTEIGKIAKILSTQIKEKTPLEKNIDKIGKVITIGVLGIVLIVFGVQIIFNKNMSVLDSLLTAVALAVAAIPESLPAVITIIMALGVQKLARKNAVVKKLSSVETLGCCNVICSDKTGTLTQNKMSVKTIFVGDSFVSAKEKIKSSKLLRCSATCNNARIESKEKIIADATETAIVKFLINQGIDVSQVKKQTKRLAESEFNSSKKTMGIICETVSGNVLFEKGAIDYLLDLCESVLIDDKVVPLTEKLKQKILDANEKTCENGERVISFAEKENPESLTDDGLTFLGFMGIIDPPRDEAISAIKTCKKAGLTTLMITGDHPSTAFAIAKKLGIATSKKEVLTGDKLDHLKEKELAKIVHNYRVFARVTPKHKLMIVEALKSCGDIVAMTGDGINDAPSIKCANIGACMGITGTDVTKEVSDIIISDDNFNSIVVAIKEGRTIYQNIEKTILFLLSTNIVEVLGIFVTSLVMPNAVFLLPAQILFINLVTDSLPAFALGIEPAEKDIMNKPPRDPHKSLLSGVVGSSIIYQGFVQSLIVLVMFVLSTKYFGGKVASTMVFLTICLMQIIHAINCKSEHSIFKINIFKNHFFNFSFLLLLSVILCTYFIPFLANMFGLVTLSTFQWLIVAITSVSIIPLVEIGKIFIK
jgi:Ca2+-transporting ATPase